MTLKKKYDIIKITKKFSDRIRELIQSFDMPREIMADNIGISLTLLNNIMYHYKEEFNVFEIDRICCYFKLRYLELVRCKEIIDDYEGGIMGLEILDAVYNILDKREGYWQEGAEFLLYRMDGLDLAIPKDIIEDWLDNFMSGVMKKLDDIKEREEGKKK